MGRQHVDAEHKTTAELECIAWARQQAIASFAFEVPLYVNERPKNLAPVVSAVLLLRRQCASRPTNSTTAASSHSIWPLGAKQQLRLHFLPCTTCLTACFSLAAIQQAGLATDEPVHKKSQKNQEARAKQSEGKQPEAKQPKTTNQKQRKAKKNKAKQSKAQQPNAKQRNAKHT